MEYEKLRLIDSLENKNALQLKNLNDLEKRIELSQKYPSNNFILICKSDYLGNVNMPKLKFSVNEDNKMKANTTPLAPHSITLGKRM